MNHALVVFDFDGVLVDSAPGIRHCLDSALVAARLAPASDVEARSVMGPPLHIGVADILRDRAADTSLVDAVVGHFRTRYATASLQMTRVYPGVPPMLAALRDAGHRTALATSKPRPATEALLDQLGLRAGVEPIGCPIDLAHDTKTDILRRVMQQAGEIDGRVVMVGDRWHDIAAARVLGVHAVGALWGYGSADELGEAGAEVLVDRPDGISAVVEELR